MGWRDGGRESGRRAEEENPEYEYEYEYEHEQGSRRRRSLVPLVGRWAVEVVASLPSPHEKAISRAIFATECALSGRTKGARSRGVWPSNARDLMRGWIAVCADRSRRPVCVCQLSRHLSIHIETGSTLAIRKIGYFLLLLEFALIRGLRKSVRKWSVSKNVPIFI